MIVKEEIQIKLITEIIIIIIITMIMINIVFENIPEIIVQILIIKNKVNIEVINKILSPNK